jgi:hypothetical protein
MLSKKDHFRRYGSPLGGTQRDDVTGLILYVPSGKRGVPSSGGWSEGSERERFEVLHDGGEMELVASTGKTPKPHPLEAVVSLQMREPHFDPLSLVSRSGECLCLHLSPCDITGVFVEVARDLARISRGAALCSERAHIAVALRRAVEQRTSLVHGATGPQQLAAGTDVDPRFLSQRKSEREKMPSCRSLFSQTGCAG